MIEEAKKRFRTMTREKLDKIARRYAQDELKDNHSAVEDIVAAAFLNGIDYAENHPRWISVEDELPKIEEANCEWVGSEDVLALLWNGDMSVGRYERDNISGEYYWTLYNVDKDHQVTHWMPLPQPPMEIRGNQRKISPNQQQIIGTTDHIKIAMDVIDKKGGEQ